MRPKHRIKEQKAFGKGKVKKVTKKTVKKGIKLVKSKPKTFAEENYKAENLQVIVASHVVSVTILNGQYIWDRDTKELRHFYPANPVIEGQYATKENFDDVEKNSTEDRAGSPTGEVEETSSAPKTDEWQKQS